MKTMTLPLPDTNLADRVLEKLLEETRLAIEVGDLPVGCALTVGDTLLDSNRNTSVRNRGGVFMRNATCWRSLAILPFPPVAA